MLLSHALGSGIQAITIFGNDLDPVSDVLVGGSICRITTSNDTHIECDLGLKNRGHNGVKVMVDGKGLASGDVSYEFVAEVTGISPKSGHLSGKFINS